MRSPFYLDKRPNGYYRVRFCDLKTGIVSVAKSTHTKNLKEARTIVFNWLQNGIPEGRIDGITKTESITTAVNKTAYDAAVHLLKNVSFTDSEKKKLSDVMHNFLGITASPSVSSEKNSAQSDATPIKSDRKAITESRLCEWLTKFWTPETSKYIQSKRAHGLPCTERHCYEMRGLINRYWLPFFGDNTLIGELDQDALEDFFMSLKLENELSGATINKAINSGSVALKFAFEHKMLSENPMTGIMRYKTDEVKRGILDDEEVSALFRMDWNSETQRLASLLGAFCGMRAGEIAGLRVCDIGDDVIHIRHAWSTKDGLKSTKNYLCRDVPVIPQIGRELLAHAKEGRNFSDLSYIFFSPRQNQNQPVDPSDFEDGLCWALNRIGISEEQRKERNIVFHSWRHYYAKQMAERMKLEQAQQALGHLTPEMTRHYSDHRIKQDFEVLTKAMTDTYNHILKFPEPQNTEYGCKALA